MAETLKKKMTVEEFFEWQRGQDRNYELVDGVPVLTVKAMTGATDRHDRITVNAIIVLGSQLRGKPCRPKTDDTSVHTFRGARRPDVIIECGKPKPTDLTADEPRMVIEVLSPSTIRFDRFQKLAEYQQHPAIRLILLVDSEAPQVTLWRRDGDRWSAEEMEGLAAILSLPEIEASLPMSELYAGVEFQE